MAVCFSNRSRRAPPRPSASLSAKPSKTLETKTSLALQIRSLHHRPRLCYPMICLSHSNSSPISYNHVQRRSFKASFAADDSASTIHEAIAQADSQEYKEGIIIQEFRRGFLLGDRLLRPAVVKASAGPGRKKACQY